MGGLRPTTKHEACLSDSAAPRCWTTEGWFSGSNKFRRATGISSQATAQYRSMLERMISWSSASGVELVDSRATHTIQKRGRATQKPNCCGPKLVHGAVATLALHAVDLGRGGGE